MINWKTTVLGLVACLMTLLAGPVQQLSNGQPVDWLQVASAVALGLLGYFAKDKNVTGAH